MNSGVRLAEGLFSLFVLINVILYGVSISPKARLQQLRVKIQSHLKFLCSVMEGKRAVLESGLL